MACVEAKMRAMRDAAFFKLDRQINKLKTLLEEGQNNILPTKYKVERWMGQ